MPRRLTPMTTPTTESGPSDIQLTSVRARGNPRSPLPGYDEALNAPTLMETTFITSAFDGTPTPFHLREKLRSRFMLLILSCTGLALTFDVPEQSQMAVQSIGVSMFLSFYGICISNVLDDFAFGSHPKIYRFIHAIIEFIAVACWVVINLIAVASSAFSIYTIPWTLIFLSAMNTVFWAYSFAVSVHKIFKYRNIRENLEDNYPDIRIDATGRLNLSGDAIVWLAQPRNKIRLFQAYLCICILTSGYPDVKTSRVHVSVATFALTTILSFCYDAAWKKHFSSSIRLALDVLLDFTFMGIQLFVAYQIKLGDLAYSLNFYQLSLFLARIYSAIWTMKVGFSTNLFNISLTKFRASISQNGPYSQVQAEAQVESEPSVLADQ